MPPKAKESGNISQRDLKTDDFLPEPDCTDGGLHELVVRTRRTMERKLNGHGEDG